MAINKYSIVFFIAVIIVVVKATPNGAGDAACTGNSMDPSSDHGGADSTDTSPYGIMVSRTTYSEEETLTVTLKGTEGFAGFLVLALRADNETAAPVGSFEAFNSSDNELVKTHCSGAGLTHTGSFSGLTTKRDELKLTWKAPSSGVGDVKFYATFVKTQLVYWVKEVAADVVTYSERVDDEVCGNTSSCFHNCEDDECEDFILRWKNGTAANTVQFELQGSLMEGQGYIALGLSKDKMMTNVTIMVCALDGDTLKVENLFAPNQSKPMANAGDPVDPSTATVYHYVKDDKTYISCSFTYDNAKAKTMLTDDKWKDLEQSNYIFIARGKYNNTVHKHTAAPIVTKQAQQLISSTVVEVDVSTDDDGKDDDKDGDKGGDKTGDSAATTGQRSWGYLMTMALPLVLGAFL